MSTFDERVEKSLLKLFKTYASPVKIILTETVAGGNIGSPATKHSVTLKKNGELIKGFFVQAKTENGIQVANEYEGELIVDDITFDITSCSFDTGIFVQPTIGQVLVVNSVSIDVGIVTTLDELLLQINNIPNVVGLKLSDTEFVVISSIKDKENDLDYMDLTVSGDYALSLGIKPLSKKSSVSIKINNRLYSCPKIFNGSYVKCLYLKRG